MSRVIAGLVDVPPEAIAESGRAAFAKLRDELLSSPVLVTTMVLVFVGWVASHATGIGGLIIDAALLGIAIWSLGSLAFDWFERLATLVGDIDAADRAADLQRCSRTLANLIVEIGIAAFITLVTRAAGKRISKVGDKPAEPLKTVPPSGRRGRRCWATIPNTKRSQTRRGIATSTFRPRNGTALPRACRRTRFSPSSTSHLSTGQLRGG